jgi:hypothetical protein
MLGSTALAQHGVLIQKSCVSPVCVGEATDCTINIGHADFFGDTVRIMAAWDVVDIGMAGDNVRVPAVGNLPITAVFGNTTCVVGGSLPCNVGAAGSILNGLPGDPNPGLVSFSSNTYVVEIDDPSPLPDQANVQVTDLCDDPDTMGCSSLVNTVQFTASTTFPDCDDNSECTSDSCAEGICSNTPIECDDGNPCTTDTCDPATGCVFTPECTTAAECDDGDACTTDTCSALGCCEHTPVVCDDDNSCTTDTCDSETGCVFTPECLTPADCDDGNECTDEVCTAQGCCENPPITCDDDNSCTMDSCDPATGCVFDPGCDGPADCNDGNECTDDICTAQGCCENPPITCDDDNSCTTDSCDPATGCVFDPDCDGPADCNDGNECTDDVCTAQGCCENPPITCDDDNSCTTDSCDPATGCVFDPDCETDADCDDDDACTNDSCSAEGCCEHDLVVCDDMDPCTDDTCDSATGCVFTDNGTCGGGEGCTPGYWKLVDADPATASHECNWTDPYDPTDLFSDHFENAFPGKTLLDVLSLGGGGLNALGRHTVAALLNAASPDVEYDIDDPQDVIDAFNDVFPGTKDEYNALKDEFAGFNEQDCPIANCNNQAPAASVRERGGRR